MNNKIEKIQNYEKILWELQKYVFEIPDDVIDAFLKEAKDLHEAYIIPVKFNKSGECKDVRRTTP